MTTTKTAPNDTKDDIKQGTADTDEVARFAAIALSLIHI